MNDLHKEYGDQSGYMGLVYKQGQPLMCFNAAKSWQLGWYDDKAVIVSPSSSSWSGRMMGISDYDHKTTQIVIIKIETETSEDYYINFNRKSGINRGTMEGGDRVLITRQGKDGIGYSKSKLLAKLSSDDTYTISNFGGSTRSVQIKVNRISTSTFPGYADVSIRMTCSSDSHCERNGMFACSSYCNLNTKTCETNPGCNCDNNCDSGEGEDKYQCPSDCRETLSLETTNQNKGTHHGTMFDIRATNEVQITSFEIRAQNQGKYLNAHIFAKQGGRSGFERDKNAWTHIQSARIQSRGESELTPLPKLPNAIVVPPGSTRAFYITLETNDLVHTSGFLKVSDSNLLASEGIGVAYPFSNSYSPRIWSGIINYVKVESSPAPVVGIPTQPQAGGEGVAIKKKRMKKRRKKKGKKKENIPGVAPKKRQKRKWTLFRGNP